MTEMYLLGHAALNTLKISNFIRFLSLSIGFIVIIIWIITIFTDKSNKYSFWLLFTGVNISFSPAAACLTNDIYVIVDEYISKRREEKLLAAENKLYGDCKLTIRS